MLRVLCVRCWDQSQGREHAAHDLALNSTYTLLFTSILSHVDDGFPTSSEFPYKWVSSRCQKPLTTMCVCMCWGILLLTTCPIRTCPLPVAHKYGFSALMPTLYSCSFLWRTRFHYIAVAGRPWTPPFHLSFRMLTHKHSPCHPAAEGVWRIQTVAGCQQEIEDSSSSELTLPLCEVCVNPQPSFLPEIRSKDDLRVLGQPGLRGPCFNLPSP